MSSSRPHNYNNRQIEEAIILACRKSPWFFITHYCYTEDPDDEEEAFKLFPDKEYLRIIAEQWQQEQILLVPKSRQMLLTWLMLCLHLWKALFHHSQWIFVQGKREEDVVILLDRIRSIYSHLPAFLQRQTKIYKDTVIKIAFSNRSRITGLPEGGSKIRGETISALLSDEFAFQESGREAFKAAKPAVGKTGKITLISSAEVSFFYELVSDEGYNGPQCIETPIRGMRMWRNRGNGHKVVEVKYTADPDKDPERNGGEWFRRMRGMMSETEWEREMEINWSVRAGKRFYPEFKRDYIRELIPDLSKPIYRAWDFGFHHPAVLWAQIDWENIVDGCARIYILHELMGEDISLERFAKDQVLPVYAGLRDIYDKPIHFIDCCDAAGTQRNDKSEKTSIEILNVLGINPRWQRIGIKPGTDMVRRIIKAEQLYVDIICENMVEGFMGGYIFPEMRPGLTKELSELPEAGNFFGHLMDALRYIVVVFLGVYMDTRNGRRVHEHKKVVGAGNKRKRELHYVRRIQ